MEGIQQQIFSELMKRGLGVEEATKLAKNVDPRAKNITQILNQITKQRPLPPAPATRLGQPAARGLASRGTLTAAATALANNPLKMTGIGAGASLVGLGGLALLNTEPEDIGRLIGQGQLAFEDVRDKIDDIADKAGSTYNNIMSRIKSGYDEVVNPPMPDMPVGPMLESEFLPGAAKRELFKKEDFFRRVPSMPSQPLPEQQMQPMPIIPEMPFDPNEDPIGFAEGGPAKIAEMLQDINKNPVADFLAEGTPKNQVFADALKDLGEFGPGVDRAIIRQTPGLADFLASGNIQEIFQESGRTISNQDMQILKNILDDVRGIDKTSQALSRLDKILSSGLGRAKKGKQEGVKISEKSVEFLPANMLDMK
jgi:hypothetical protein